MAPHGPATPLCPAGGSPGGGVLRRLCAPLPCVFFGCVLCQGTTVGAVRMVGRVGRESVGAGARSGRTFPPAARSAVCEALAAAGVLEHFRGVFSAERRLQACVWVAVNGRSEQQSDAAVQLLQTGRRAPSPFLASVCVAVHCTHTGVFSITFPESFTPHMRTHTHHCQRPKHCIDVQQTLSLFLFMSSAFCLRVVCVGCIVFTSSLCYFVLCVTRHHGQEQAGWSPGRAQVAQPPP